MGAGMLKLPAAASMYRFCALRLGGFRTFASQKPPSRSPAWALLNKRAAAGDVVGAEKVFKQLLKKEGASTMLYNTVLKAHANDGAAEPARRWLGKMQSANVQVNAKTYGKIIEAFAKNNDVDGARKWRKVAIDAGFKEGARWYDSMVADASARSGDVAAAEKSFQHSGSARGRVQYRILLNACAKGGDFAKAADYLRKMRKEHLNPGTREFNSVIEACAKIGQSNEAATWLKKMCQQVVQPDVITLSNLIDSCAKATASDESAQWLQKARDYQIVPNNVCYSAVINSFAKAGRARDAAKCIKKMIKAQVAPNVVSYTAVIDAYARQGQRAEAGQLLEQMKGRNITPDLPAYNAVMNACAKGTSAEDAARWLAEMDAKRVQPDIITLTSAMAAFGHGQGRKWRKSAEGLLRRMVTDHVSPDRVFADTAKRTLGADRFKRFQEELGFQVTTDRPGPSTKHSKSRHDYRRRRLQASRDFSLQAAKATARKKR